MQKLLLAFLLSGCLMEEIGDPRFDLSSLDLSGVPDTLCTSSACAGRPCSPGCVFESEVAGNCPASSPERISTTLAVACPGWCGLQQIGVEGCLRYRSEDPACPTWCISWGDASCWERTPAADYSSGGAICSAGSSCFGGAPLDDLYTPCVDLGGAD